jgi:hypothetical protein
MQMVVDYGLNIIPEPPISSACLVTVNKPVVMKFILSVKQGIKYYIVILGW